MRDSTEEMLLRLLATSIETLDSIHKGARPPSIVLPFMSDHVFYFNQKTDSYTAMVFGQPVTITQLPTDTWWLVCKTPPRTLCTNSSKYLLEALQSWILAATKLQLPLD